MSMRPGWKGWACALGAMTLSASTAFAQVTQSQSNFTVQLRPGVSSVVTGTWYNCPTPSDGAFENHCGSTGPSRRTIVALPGLSHTSATYAPLAAELCAGLTDSAPTSILAIDLPGHGLSADPQGMLFSDVSQEDYAVAVEGVLGQLRAQQARTVAAIGHSMGGLVLQRIQARLLASGSTLQNAYGINSAVMIAPVPVREVAWPFADSGAAGPVLESFITEDPVRGTVARVPAEAFPALFFTTTTGVVVPGTPAPADIAALGYTADEPLIAGLELVGSGGLSRPSAPAGAFSALNGTNLSIITLSEDGFYTNGEHTALYQHLTGDTSNASLISFVAPDAVHDLHLARPQALVAPILESLALIEPEIETQAAPCAVLE